MKYLTFFMLLILSPPLLADSWIDLGEITRIWIKRGDSAIILIDSERANTSTAGSCPATNGYYIDEPDNPQFVRSAYAMLLGAYHAAKEMEGKEAGCGSLEGNRIGLIELRYK